MKNTLTRITLAATLSGLLGVGATGWASAQASPSPDDSAAEQASNRGDRRAHRARRGRMARMAQQLGLTDVQKTELRALRQQMRTARQAGTDRAEARAQFEAGLIEILTPDQRAQAQAHRAQAQAHRGNRHRGKNVRARLARLNLTDAQKQQVRQVMTSHRQRRQQLSESLQAEIGQILTDEQKAQFEAHTQAGNGNSRGNTRRQRRGRPGGEQVDGAQSSRGSRGNANRQRRGQGNQNQRRQRGNSNR